MFRLKQYPKMIILMNVAITFIGVGLALVVKHYSQNAKVTTAEA